MEQPRLKPKQPKSVRWLSHGAACDTMKKIPPCVVVHLDKEAAENNDPQAFGLKRLIECWEFVAALNVMCDILPHLSTLSKYFQVMNLKSLLYICIYKIIVTVEKNIFVHFTLQHSSLDFCGVKEQIETTKAILDARLMMQGFQSKRLAADLDLLNEEGLHFPYTQDQLAKFKSKV